MNNLQFCRCCRSATQAIFTGVLLNHQVSYFECPVCAYVQTETPYWLKQAYAEAINDSDTGIMSRNQTNAHIVLSTLLLLGKLDRTVVDCAGGYGILVRLLRDLGVNAFWTDRYCQNLLAKGFDFKNEEAHLVTSFEAFEHFINPAEELDVLLSIAPNILFSTAIISNPAPRIDDWWYYGKNHGQHIGFFRMRTLKMLAEERGKFLVSDGRNYHLITSRPINEFVWKIFLRFNKYAKLFFRRSLTMVDHEYIMKTSKKS